MKALIVLSIALVLLLSGCTNQEVRKPQNMTFTDLDMNRTFTVEVALPLDEAGACAVLDAYLKVNNIEVMGSCQAYTYYKSNGVWEANIPDPSGLTGGGGLEIDENARTVKALMALL